MSRLIFPLGCKKYASKPCYIFTHVIDKRGEEMVIRSPEKKSLVYRGVLLAPVEINGKEVLEQCWIDDKGNAHVFINYLKLESYE